MEDVRRAAALRIGVYAMKLVCLHIASAALLLLGVWTLFEQFQGSANLNAAWPLSSFTFQISGTAKGGWVAAAILLLIFSAATFIWALITAIAGRMRPPDAPPSASDSRIVE